MTEVETKAKAKLFMSRDIGDDLLAYAYLRFKEEALLPVMFCSRQAPGLRGFLDWHRDENNLWLACFRCPALDMTLYSKKDPELTGLGWINWRDGVRAEVGLGFFRAYHRTAVPWRFTQMLLRHCFVDLRLEVIYGVSAVHNEPVLDFARKLGFEQFGPLPKFCTWDGTPCNGMIFAMTKEVWSGTEF